jgi:NADPH:quinone reductase-like Zn-dependent oxidoreductase
MQNNNNENKKMKAIVFRTFGPPEVLKIEEVDKPTPKKNEVLIKIHATTVHVGDTIIRKRKHPSSKFYTMMMPFAIGFRKPKWPILGMELAGEIEAVGADVKLFKKGDQVFASTGSIKLGAYAEYRCFPENGMIALKPTNLTYGEAAAVPTGAPTALVNLRKGHIAKNQKLLIYGASGSVGTYAVQIAKHFGAKITGVCSTKNLALVKSLGAKKVIDYTKEDFAASGEKYDFVFDAVGKSASKLCKSVLTENGVYVSVLKTPTGENLDDLIFIKDLIEKGELKPVIDRTYPMEKIAEAHAYVDKGHKKGHVVIEIMNI